MMGGMVNRLNPDGTCESVPHIFCDICGWGDSIVESRNGFDFCRRHKPVVIDEFIAAKSAGKKVGYIDKLKESV